MGKSGNPAARAAQKAEQLKISAVGDFKRRIGGIFELPSGLVVRLKNPGGMMAFMKSGLIPNSLMSIIQDSLQKGSADGTEVLNSSGGIDDEMMEAMTQMTDAVAMKCMVEPRLSPVPTEADLLVWNEEHPDDIKDSPEDLRRDDVLYVDELPETDKMYIFQWVSGGTTDLATFRQRYDQNVAAVAEESVTRASAK